MINLKEVITKYPESLKDGSKLKGILSDLYPQEKLYAGILSDMLSDGIVAEIKDKKELDSLTFKSLCDRVENNRGLAHKHVEGCLNIWANAFDVKILQLDKDKNNQKKVTKEINPDNINSDRLTKEQLEFSKELEELQSRVDEMNQQEYNRQKLESKHEKQSTDWYWQYQKRNEPSANMKYLESNTKSSIEDRNLIEKQVLKGQAQREKETNDMSKTVGGGILGFVGMVLAIVGFVGCSDGLFGLLIVGVLGIVLLFIAFSLLS